MSEVVRGPGGVPAVAIVGWKKSGKTTLTVRLVEELTRRGRRVATVKHAHHAFQIDDAETDSARHRRAGAQQVAVVSSERWAMVRELAGAPEPDFADVLSWLDPCDIVVVEGYKSARVPKIEARRLASHTKRPLAGDDPLVMAIAADHAIADAGAPVYGLDDIVGLADLIERKLGPLGASSPAATKTEANRS